MNTTSLDLSKRIATLEGGNGVSEYWWVSKMKYENFGEGFKRVDDSWVAEKSRTLSPSGLGWIVPALTTDELLERLPFICEGKYLQLDKSKNTYWAGYVSIDNITEISKNGDIPAEALGLLYEHLLIKGLIT